METAWYANRTRSNRSQPTGKGVAERLLPRRATYSSMSAILEAQGRHLCRIISSPPFQTLSGTPPIPYSETSTSAAKYRDVILPMTVIRRLDSVLEPTKQQVVDLKKSLDAADIAEQTGPLQQAAGQQFYNASPFTLRDLRSATSQQQLRDNFHAYLDGFSPNVQDILEKFEFRNQTARLSNGGVLDALIERFLTPTVNFSPNPDSQRGRDGEDPGPRQPRHGIHIRGPDPQVQRGE